MLRLHNVKVRYLHEFGLDLNYGMGKIMFCTEQKRLLVSKILTRVGDPDLHVFGPPGSGSGSMNQRYRSLPNRILTQNFGKKLNF
jgi:hypothetical protein